MTDYGKPMTASGAMDLVLADLKWRKLDLSRQIDGLRERMAEVDKMEDYVEAHKRSLDQYQPKPAEGEG